MADIDPTQTGGQEKTETLEEQIAARVNEAQADDMSSFDEETGVIDAKPVPAEDEEAEPDPAPAAAPQDTPAPKMVAIVVDGQTIEVEESRLLEAGKRTLQKTEAADRRLQEAVDKNKQADEYLRRAQQLSPQRDAEPAPSQDAPPAFTQEMLDSVVENKLYNRDAQKAAAKFRADFPDIASDPHLMNMAINLENQRIATVTALGESFGDPFDAYHKHGETIQKWLGKYKPAAAVSEDKAERKKTIVAVPSASAKAPQIQEDKPPTIQQVIADERKARLGRPSPNRSH